MVRFSLSAAALAASLFALAACASPEGERTSAAAVAEAPPVEASTAELASPGLVVQVADAEDALTMPVNYSCSDNRSFIATFPENGNSVVVAAAGDVRILSHKGATDAVMFTDTSGATLSAEGAGATLTGLGDGPYLDCMAG